MATCREPLCATRTKGDQQYFFLGNSPTNPPKSPARHSLQITLLHEIPPYALASASGTNCLPSFNTYSANPSTLIIFNPHSFANLQQSSRLAMDPAGS